MLQPRSSSPGGMPSGQQTYMASQPRATFQQMPSYRGVTGPIQPYAFTTTPGLHNVQFNGSTGRAHSSPSATYTLGPDQRQSGTVGAAPVAYRQPMGVGISGSRDDSYIQPPRTVVPGTRPQSAYLSSSSSSPSFAQAIPPKSRPDRYRRPSQQAQPRSLSSGNVAMGAAASSALEQQQPKTAAWSGNAQPALSGPFVDDMQLNRRPVQDETRRLRRRSMHTLDSADYPKPLTPQELARLVNSTTARSHAGTPTMPQRSGDKQPPKSLRPVSNSSQAGAAMHSRHGSAESSVSHRSSRPGSAQSRPSVSPASKLANQVQSRY